MMGMYGFGIPGWMMLINGLITLLFWGGLIGLAVWGLTRFTGTRRHDDSAEEILKRRLAAGEISQEEYERTRRVLQG